MILLSSADVASLESEIYGTLSVALAQARDGVYVSQVGTMNLARRILDQTGITSESRFLLEKILGE